MSINSSSSSILSTSLVLHYCSTFEANITFSVFIVTKSVTIFLLSGLVFYLGHQQWRQQRSFKNTSHSDIFTYHLTGMELIGTFSCPLYLCGFAVPYLFTLGSCVIPSFICGEIIFHLLTCVERYLAVVHPLTYLGLKKASGVRIRKICIGCVWLITSGWVGLMVWYSPDFPFIHFFCFLAFSFVVVSSCSISVLYILLRPGPGEGNRDRVDQSKMRAFHTIMSITLVLLLMFVGELICVALYALNLLDYKRECFLMPFAMWVSLPSSLMLPLLFLQRTGKLQLCQITKKKIKLTSDC